MQLDPPGTLLFLPIEWHLLYWLLGGLSDLFLLKRLEQCLRHNKCWLLLLNILLMEGKETISFVLVLHPEVFPSLGLVLIVRGSSSLSKSF